MRVLHRHRDELVALQRPADVDGQRRWRPGIGIVGWRDNGGHGFLASVQGARAGDVCCGALHDIAASIAIPSSTATVHEVGSALEPSQQFTRLNRLERAWQSKPNDANERVDAPADTAAEGQPGMPGDVCTLTWCQTSVNLEQLPKRRLIGRCSVQSDISLAAVRCNAASVLARESVWVQRARVCQRVPLESSSNMRKHSSSLSRNFPSGDSSASPACGWVHHGP